MKDVRWNELKNTRLKKLRGVSFEEILDARLIEIMIHPAREGQQLMLFEYRGYIWVVPFIETETMIFLKTLYPSRKYTELYYKGIRK